MPELESRIYNARLKNEYEEVMKLNHAGNKLFTISAAAGERMPNVRKYELTYHGETWVAHDGRPVRQKGLKMNIILHRDFPYSAPHCEVVSGSPVPYHVNWWKQGHVCNGVAWMVTSHMDEYIRFVVEVLQFKPERVNPGSSAMRHDDAKPWWLEHKDDNRYFPTDSTPWPGKRTVPKIRFV